MDRHFHCSRKIDRTLQRETPGMRSTKHLQRHKKFLHFFLILLSAFTLTPCQKRAHAESEKLYVQSVKANLMAEPQLNSRSLAILKRGTELKVIRKEGTWYQVSALEKSGWVSKLFVNPTQPMGEAQLATELSQDKNLNKAARRRSSSYGVSASTRGLTSGSRVREGREKYPSDYEAVDKIDKQKAEEHEVDQFKKEGKL